MTEKKSRIKPILITILLLIVIAVAIMCYVIKLHVVISEKGQSSDDYRFTLKFKGSERHTDEELEKYFFEDNTSKNVFLFVFNHYFKDKKQIPFVETYDMEMKSFGKFEITLYDKSVVGYVKYMSNNLYFDKDGIVVESSVMELENVPQITGFEFDYFVLHEQLPTENKNMFSILLELTQLCKKYNITTDTINITGDEKIQIYVGDVRVDLGDGSMLNEKMLDLHDMYEELEGVSGILNMEEYDYEDNGYILKKN